MGGGRNGMGEGLRGVMVEEKRFTREDVRGKREGKE